jgi:transposase-like protein
LEETWSGEYGVAIRSWQNNRENLATLFEFSKEIRRLPQATITVEGFHRQLRKSIKNKGSFPTEQSVRKLLNLATIDIIKKLATPHW